MVFPSLNLKRALPLNEAVVIELTPAKAEEIAFASGMTMLSGAVVVHWTRRASFTGASHELRDLCRAVSAMVLRTEIDSPWPLPFTGP